MQRVKMVSARGNGAVEKAINQAYLELYQRGYKILPVAPSVVVNGEYFIAYIPYEG